MLVTKRKYAEMRAVSERTIHNWIEDGYVVREDGKINVEQSNARLKQYHRTGGVPLAKLRQPDPEPEPCLITVELETLAAALDHIIDRVVAEMVAANWELAPREIGDIIAECRDEILAELSSSD
jgi:hypothetical protein